MSCHLCLPQDEHITLVKPLTRASSLIQYKNDSLHLPAHKMHMEVEAIGGPPWALRDRTVDWWGRTREGHPVFHRGGREKCWRNCGRGTSQLAVLCFYVGGQGWKFQIRSALCENDLKYLPQSMWIALDGHLTPIYDFGASAWYQARMEHHKNHLRHVGTQPHPLESILPLCSVFYKYKHQCYVALHISQYPPSSVIPTLPLIPSWDASDIPL